MIETLTTPDGRFHTLIGSTTLASIVRDYAGDQAAGMVQALAERDAYEEARVETDLGAYEQSLDHWHRMAQDWTEELARLISRTGRTTKAELSLALIALKAEIEGEL